MPKSAAPMTSGASMRLWKSIGRRRNSGRKKIAVTATAPAITRSRLGSQLPATSRKSSTLPGEDVPDEAGCDKPDDEEHPPRPVARRLSEEAMQDAAHAGDAAVGGEQPHARRADQQSSGKRGDWSKVIHE